MHLNGLIIVLQRSVTEWTHLWNRDLGIADFKDHWSWSWDDLLSESSSTLSFPARWRAIGMDMVWMYHSQRFLDSTDKNWECTPPWLLMQYMAIVLSISICATRRGKRPQEPTTWASICWYGVWTPRHAKGHVLRGLSMNTLTQIGGITGNCNSRVTGEKGIPEVHKVVGALQEGWTVSFSGCMLWPTTQCSKGLTSKQSDHRLMRLSGWITLGKIVWSVWYPGQTLLN